MLTSKGLDVALTRTARGRFDLKLSTSGTNKGNFELSSERHHAAATTLFVRKRGKRPGDKEYGGGYYWDTSGRFGTLLWTITQDRTATRSQLISAGQDAGKQLVDDRMITAYSVDATRRANYTIGQWVSYLGWTLPSGDQKDLTF